VVEFKNDVDGSSLSFVLILTFEIIIASDVEVVADVVDNVVDLVVSFGVEETGIGSFVDGLIVGFVLGAMEDVAISSVNLVVLIMF